MSEYQYYEFQAADRPLDEAALKTLREISSRARITTTSFTNSYDWGDFKGDPASLMEKWFDLHLYLANWGSRRLMIRWPARLVHDTLLGAFLGKVDGVEYRRCGKNLILDIAFEDLELDDWDDGAGWLAALAPLRTDVLRGDLRLFYLLWLSSVELGVFEPDEPEPMPFIGPLTGGLDAFARFCDIDADLVAAATERTDNPHAAPKASSETARSTIAAMPEREKVDLLARLFDGDAHVGSELRARVRLHAMSRTDAPVAAARTVGELRARTDAIRRTRELAQAEKAAAERERREAEAERARRGRLDVIVRRGESVWQEIEAEIARRNATGYDTAAGLLLDLKAIAEENGATEDFDRRLVAIRKHHARKERFIERLAKLG